MNILITTENYSRGGLEDFISSVTYELHKLGDNVFIAIGSYGQNPLSIPQENRFLDFRFADNYSETIGDFIEDVERLESIITQNSIDIVLAQPFFSLLPSVLAAKLSGIPIAYVAHGPASLAFLSGATGNALMQHALCESIDHCFTVNEDLLPALEQIRGGKSMLRNPVDISVDGAGPAPTKIWAMASRLDYDKTEGIKRFLAWLPHLDIDLLKVYGDGSCKAELVQYVQALGLSNRVSWEGYRHDWLTECAGTCCGVVGLGRVAIEALCAGFPVILISTSFNPIGIVDSDLFNKSNGRNFTARYAKSLAGPYELRMQIADCYANPNKYEFQDSCKELFSASSIANELHNKMQELSPYLFDSWENFFESLKHVSEKDSSIYTSPEIPPLLQYHLGFATDSPNAQIAINVATSSVTLEQKIEDLETRLARMAMEIETLRETRNQDQNDAAASLNKLSIEQSKLADVVSNVEKEQANLNSKVMRIDKNTAGIIRRANQLRNTRLWAFCRKMLSRQK